MKKYHLVYCAFVPDLFMTICNLFFCLCIQEPRVICVTAYAAGWRGWACCAAPCSRRTRWPASPSAARGSAWRPTYVSIPHQSEMSFQIIDIIEVSFNLILFQMTKLVDTKFIVRKGVRQCIQLGSKIKPMFDILGIH